MNKVLPIIVILLDTAILCFSAIILFTIVGMSVMIFDTGETTEGWLMFGTIAAVCLALFVSAIYCAIHFYKKQRYLWSVIGSAIPLFAFGFMQVIAEML